MSNEQFDRVDLPAGAVDVSVEDEWTFVQTVTAERLAQTCEGPLWDRDEPISVLRCLRVILNEECEHRRSAERDLGL